MSLLKIENVIKTYLAHRRRRFKMARYNTAHCYAVNSIDGINEKVVCQEELYNIRAIC